MNSLRILILAAVLACGPLLRPALADEPAAPGHGSEMIPGSDSWGGPGGVYQVMAMSLGVLTGVTAMSWFIDGWVVDLFSSSSGITVREAVELVQDLESYGGVEAAAILLAGLAGGLVAERLYVHADHVLPATVAAIDDAFRPPFNAASNAWFATSGWVQDRYGDTHDWVQARSRELWDRWQMWREQLTRHSR